MDSSASLRLVERTTSNLTAETFRELERSELFWGLVDGGIASLVRSRAAPYGVRLGALVGEAILEDGTHLSIQEKVPGTLSALLGWALPDDIRAAEAPSSVDAQSPVLSAYASHFLTHLAEYLRHGQVKEYRSRIQATATPRGSVRVGPTARLRARGVRGTVVVRRSELSGDNLPNRLLSLACRSIEPLASSAGWDQSVPVRARSLAAALGPAKLYRLEQTSIERRFQLFDEVLRDPRVSGDLYGALAFARALVLHLGAWSGSVEEALPRSFFLSLETLFEEAVRRVMQATCPDCMVEKGSVLKRPLFTDLPERYVADPDVVVIRGEAPLLIADVKYKDLEGVPAHSDVYQLVSHCSAFGCTRGVLIYPGDTIEVNLLGTTDSSTSIYWAKVRAGNLESDIAEVTSPLLAS